MKYPKIPTYNILLVYTSIICIWYICEVLLPATSSIATALQRIYLFSKKNQKNCLLLISCSSGKVGCERVSPLSSRVFLRQNYCWLSWSRTTDHLNQSCYCIHAIFVPFQSAYLCTQPRLQWSIQHGQLMIKLGRSRHKSLSSVSPWVASLSIRKIQPSPLWRGRVYMNVYLPTWAVVYSVEAQLRQLLRIFLLLAS